MEHNTFGGVDEFVGTKPDPLVEGKHLYFHFCFFAGQPLKGSIFSDLFLYWLKSDLLASFDYELERFLG